jgi:hypothetical protein
MSDFSEKAGNRSHEVSPSCLLIVQRSSAATRQRIETSASASTSRPRAAEQTSLFEPMQGRIDRPFRQIEHAAASVPYLLDYGVAVRRPPYEGREDNQIQVSL